MSAAAPTVTNDAKKELRRTLKASLSQISEENLAQQSDAAQSAILALPQYRNATRIGVYLAMPNGEARTDLILRHAFDSGKAVFVPYIYKAAAAKDVLPNRNVMEMLRLRSVSDWESLRRDGWGILSLDRKSLDQRENAMGGSGLKGGETLDQASNERTAEQEGSGLDLIVVPAVAFDHGLNRLGHGAGFYDGYLSRFCANGVRKKPFLVGLCLTEQLLPGSSQIPTEKHDWRVDAVAVGNGSVVTL